jgi:hypothetical protein
MTPAACGGCFKAVPDASLPETNLTAHSDEQVKQQRFVPECVLPSASLGQHTRRSLLSVVGTKKSVMLAMGEAKNTLQCQEASPRPGLDLALPRTYKCVACDFK